MPKMIKVYEDYESKGSYAKNHPIRLKIGASGPTYSFNAQEAELIASLLADAAENVRVKGNRKLKAIKPRVQPPAIIALKQELAEIVERQVANIHYATVATVTTEIRNRRAKHLFPFAIELPKARVRYFLNQLVLDEVLHREKAYDSTSLGETITYKPFSMRP